MSLGAGDRVCGRDRRASGARPWALGYDGPMLLNSLLRRRCARLSALWLALAASPWAHATSPIAYPAAPASPLTRAAVPTSAASAAEADSDAEDSGNLSASARRIYDFGRPRLLQVRTLLRDQDSQASVG